MRKKGGRERWAETISMIKTPQNCETSRTNADLVEELRHLFFSSEKRDQCFPVALGPLLRGRDPFFLLRERNDGGRSGSGGGGGSTGGGGVGGGCSTTGGGGSGGGSGGGGRGASGGESASGGECPHVCLLEKGDPRRACHAR